LIECYIVRVSIGTPAYSASSIMFMPHRDATRIPPKSHFQFILRLEKTWLSTISPTPSYCLRFVFFISTNKTSTHARALHREKNTKCWKLTSLIPPKFIISHVHNYYRLTIVIFSNHLVRPQ
jgi:hypothetical protein